MLIDDALDHLREMRERRRCHVSSFAGLVEVTHLNDLFEIGVLFEFRHLLIVYGSALQLQRMDRCL